jgi:hypothetical protein
MMIRVAKLASLSVPVAAMALAIGLSAPAAAASHHVKASAHKAGRPLYDIAPQSRAPVNSDDPSLTGGGSLGYNQNIYNW